MNTHTSRAASWIALVSVATAAPLFGALDTPQDKIRFTLLNPTPAHLMRDLSTDRPDQTESAYTVDAGHFQLEMDLASYTYDRDGAIRTKVWSVAPLNLKLGLFHNVDLQLLLDTHVRARAEHRGLRLTEKLSGFGDIATRVKVNLWGNDGGKTALAVMPFVKWPLSTSDLRNGKTEGGLIVPLAVELPGGWGMGLMTELDFVRNAANTGYDREWVNSITFGRDLTEKVGGYIEFFTVAGSAPGFKWQGQLDIGFTYAVGPNIQLDFGCNFGVTKSAPDYQPFIGFSRRY